MQIFEEILFFPHTHKKKARKCARFVLFRPIKKRSFNLLCALDLF